jgi:hypothetical protein
LNYEAISRNGSSKSYYSQHKRLAHNHVFFEELLQDSLGTYEELNLKDNEDEHNSMENWKCWNLP